LESDVFTDEEHSHSPRDTRSNEPFNYVELNDITWLLAANGMTASRAGCEQYWNKGERRLRSDSAIDVQQFTGNGSISESQRSVVSDVPTESDDVIENCCRQLSDNVQCSFVDQYVPHALLLNVSG
jgi:hypothetical protein